MDVDPSTSEPKSDMAILSGQPQPAPFASLSKRSRKCIERLVAHRAEDAELPNVPYNRRAAVLVLLYEKDDHLRVLLTTRSKTLRTHPGQTALPGGKMDDTDRDIVETAYREAYEEVGLPMNHPDIHTVSILQPFVSWTRLLVTPIVAVLTNPDVLDNLVPCEGEVDVIFDHPFEAILDPPLSAQENLVELESESWPSDAEFYNYTDNRYQQLDNCWYRMHRFRSSASAIKGLTAEILIAVAVVAYDRPPSYNRFAPGQPTTFKEMMRSLDPSTFSDARKYAAVQQHTAHEIIVGRA